MPQPVLNAILPILAGNLQHTLNMIRNFRFIPEDIRDSGLFVPIAIQILQITHCLPALPVMIKRVLIVLIAAEVVIHTTARHVSVAIPGDLRIK